MASVGLEQRDLSLSQEVLATIHHQSLCAWLADVVEPFYGVEHKETFRQCASFGIQFVVEPDVGRLNAAPFELPLFSFRRWSPTRGFLPRAWISQI